MGIQSNWERSEFDKDSEATFPGSNTPIAATPAWGVHCLVHQLLETPFCHAQALQRGSSGFTSRNIWEDLSLEKFLLKTQRAIELCSFGKGIILHYLQHMEGTPHTHTNIYLLNHFSLPYNPDEFSHTGDQSIPQS